jgi:hypothetical protein
MNTKMTIIKNMTGLFALLLTGMNAQAQFTETMGTTGPATQTVNAREAAGLFSVASLTYSGVNSDARTTTPSHTGTGGYAGASAGYNILIQPGNETFEIHTIDASACSGGTLSFGINKNVNASNGSELVLAYSVDNGTTWTAIPFTALPTGTGTSGTTWYLRTVTLPAGAISSTLWLRFMNTQAGGSSSNPQFRIDDVAMSCGLTADCSGLTSDIDVTGDVVFCEGTASADLTVTTNMTAPTYQWFDQNGILVGETFDLYSAVTSGTYYVEISNADGCEIVSEETYVLAYPAPQLCETSIEGCLRDTIEFCPTLKTSDLIISEYVEGSNFTKYLELFNGTCDTLDMGDYELRLFTNGASTATGTDVILLPAGDLVAPGDVYVIGNEDADSNAVVVPDYVTGNLDFNGNDAIVLFNNAATFVADIFGSVGNNPGSNWRDTVSASATLGWRTENKTLYRKACVYSGITVNPALPGIYGFPTLFTEWDTLPQNTVSGLGSHTFTSGAPIAFTGTADIVSSTSTCVTVVIGAGTATLEVSPTFCGFNNCGPALVSVVENCPEARSSAIAPAVKAMNLQVFPNPTADLTTIAFELENDGAVVVTLTDLAGHVVVSKTIQAVAGEQRIELNLSEVAAGTYVCNIASANGLETVRIVKTK